jgi:hypothetical protein
MKQTECKWLSACPVGGADFSKKFRFRKSVWYGDFDLQKNSKIVLLNTLFEILRRCLRK